MSALDDTPRQSAIRHLASRIVLSAAAEISKSGLGQHPVNALRDIEQALIDHLTLFYGHE